MDDHQIVDPTSPIFGLYCDVIRDLNTLVPQWLAAGKLAKMSDSEIVQAVGSALMRFTSTYFRERYCMSESQFLANATFQFNLPSEGSPVSQQ